MPKTPELIAKCPILHLAKLYQAGDKLPTSDPVMLQAWLDAGSAEWQKDPEDEAPLPEEEKTEAENETPEEENMEAENETPEEEKPEDSEPIVTGETAEPQTAEPGLPGESGFGEPDELAGKVPKTPARAKAKKGAK